MSVAGYTCDRCNVYHDQLDVTTTATGALQVRCPSCRNVETFDDTTPGIDSCARPNTLALQPEDREPTHSRTVQHTELLEPADTKDWGVHTVEVHHRNDETEWWCPACNHAFIADQDNEALARDYFETDETECTIREYGPKRVATTFNHLVPDALQPYVGGSQ